jgi:hypothetical protein
MDTKSDLMKDETFPYNESYTVLAYVTPRAVRTALTPDGAIAILEDAVERLRLLLP